MNRNIITEADAAALNGRPPSAVAAAMPATAIQVDDYFDRLLKFVPTEAIGAYLLLDGLLRQLTSGRATLYALLGLFACGLLLTWASARYLLHVQRATQVVVSLVAFTVLVFAIGGWFKEAIPSWEAGWGSVAVIVFGLIVRFVPIQPLSSPALNQPLADR